MGAACISIKHVGVVVAQHQCPWTRWHHHGVFYICVCLLYHAPPDILRTCIRNSTALRSITLDFSSLRLSGAPPQVCGSAFLRWVAGQYLSTPMTSALPVADPEHGHCGVRGGAGVAARVLCDDPGPATWTSTGTGLAVSYRSCTWGTNGSRKATVFPGVSGHQQHTEPTPPTLCPFALLRPPCRWALTTNLLICRDLQSLTFDARLSKPSAKVAPVTEDSPMDVDELLNSGSGLILDMTDFFG